MTERAGLNRGHRGLGVLAIDLNDDGWIDFYVANDTDRNDLYWGGPQLPFREAAVQTGVAYSEYGMSEGSMGLDVGDYNGDGKPDLWVTNFEREENSMYRNDGNQQFTHTSVGLGLGAPCRMHVGFGTGLADFDSDGWDDIFVVNGNVFYQIGERPHQQQAFLFRNIGGKRFENISHVAGPYFSVPHAARGVAAGDLDNDGAVDLVVVHQNAPVSVLRNRKTPENWIRLELQGVECHTDAIGARVSLQLNGRQIVRFRCSGRGYLSHADHRLLFPLQSDEPATVFVMWPAKRREVFAGLTTRKTHKLIQGQGRGVAKDVSGEKTSAR